MTTTHIYSVPDISCEHCVSAIKGEVSGVAGVQSVDVDVTTKIVAVLGGDDQAIVAAIDAAGYDVAAPSNDSASSR